MKTGRKRLGMSDLSVSSLWDALHYSLTRPVGRMAGYRLRIMGNVPSFGCWDFL